MTATYPDDYDTFPTKQDHVDDAMAADINDVDAAIIAMEHEYGLMPKGAFVDVAARLDYIEALPGGLTDLKLAAYVFPGQANTPDMTALSKTAEIL